MEVTVPSEEAVDDPALGLRHAHAWQAFTSLPRLQSIHDHLRWDVSRSRILSFSKCSVCDDVERASVEMCEQPDCVEHAICVRPYR